MGKPSRDKGKRGEREAAGILSELFGVPVRRAQQYSGNAGTADLVGLPGVHVEVKRRERGNVANWLDQAVDDAGDETTPMVVHRGQRAALDGDGPARRPAGPGLPVVSDAVLGT